LGRRARLLRLPRADQLAVVSRMQFESVAGGLRAERHTASGAHAKRMTPTGTA